MQIQIKLIIVFMEIVKISDFPQDFSERFTDIHLMINLLY